MSRPHSPSSRTVRTCLSSSSKREHPHHPTLGPRAPAPFRRGDGFFLRPLHRALHHVVQNLEWQPAPTCGRVLRWRKWLTRLRIGDVPLSREETEYESLQLVHHPRILCLLLHHADLVEFFDHQGVGVKGVVPEIRLSERLKGEPNRLLLVPATGGRSTVAAPCSSSSGRSVARHLSSPPCEHEQPSRHYRDESTYRRHTPPC